MWDDFEDVCALQAAIKVKAGVVVSRSKRGFEGSSPRVLSCEELFSYVEQEFGLVYDDIGFWWR